MVQLRLINSAEEGSNKRLNQFGPRHRHQYGNAKAPASSSLRPSSHSARDSSVPPRTLTYTVVHVSSQDENFLASELNKGVSGCGWQSSRFCSYPQELVVELECPSNIANLQLLSHEYKIASKVEIFVSSESFWANSEEFIDQMKPLGFVSLDPNDKTRHQARELKNINLDCNAAVIRLVLHKCFANTLNVYCQVGIIALIITGEPCVGQFVKPVSMINSKDSWLEATSSDDINDSLTHVDSITAQAIIALQKEKSIAVQEENYIVANKLKVLIEKRRVTGRRIKELELQKQAAVQVEDYDSAKTCKLEIEKVRESINAAYDLTIDRTTQTSKELDKPEEWDVTTIVKDLNVERKLRDVSTQTSESEVARQFIEISAVRGSQFSENLMKEEQYTHDSTVENSVLTLSQMDPSLDEILSPEPLSEVLLKEMEPMLMLIDRYHLDCIFSRHWQLRDKGLVHLGKRLDSPGSTEPLSTFRVIVKVLVRALNDKVSNVFQTSLQALRSFINCYSSEVSNKEIHTAATDIIAVLVEKLGHSHVRTREATTQTLLFIATIKEIGLNVVAPILLKPPKTQAAWKPILGRLQLLLIAVPAFGLQPHHPLGFPIEALMSFIAHGFGSPNGHVRTAAVLVTVEAYKLMGPPLEKFLKGVKPAIHEVLIEKFEKVSSDIHRTQKTNTTDTCSESPVLFHKKKTAKCIDDANSKRYDEACHDISNIDFFDDRCVGDKIHYSQVHTLPAISTSNA